MGPADEEKGQTAHDEAPKLEPHMSLKMSHSLARHCVGDCPGDPPMATITWDKLTVVAKDSKGNSKELLKVCMLLFSMDVRSMGQELLPGPNAANKPISAVISQLASCRMRCVMRWRLLLPVGETHGKPFSDDHTWIPPSP